MTKHRFMALAAAIAVVATIATSIVLTRRDGAQNETTNRQVATLSPTAQTSTETETDPGLLPAAVADEQCSASATPSLGASVDPRLKDSLASNPASQADPPRGPMSRSEAVARARSASTAETGKDLLPAAVVQQRYADAELWFGGRSENSMVAADRCVWIVTVHGEYQPRSAPLGKTPGTFNVYTMLFDSRSGDGIALAAGSDAVDLITGKGVVN